MGKLLRVGVRTVSTTRGGHVGKGIVGAVGKLSIFGVESLSLLRCGMIRASHEAVQRLRDGSVLASVRQII